MDIRDGASTTGSDEKGSSTTGLTLSRDLPWAAANQNLQEAAAQFSDSHGGAYFPSTSGSQRPR
jgi:hypothetical protein